MMIPIEHPTQDQVYKIKKIQANQKLHRQLNISYLTEENLILTIMTSVTLS